MSSIRRGTAAGWARPVTWRASRAANGRGEQAPEPLDSLPNVVAQLAQLELRGLGMLTAMSGHHRDQQVGQVERAHHAIQEVPLGARLRLDPRVPGDGLVGECQQRLLVTAVDGVDERSGRSTAG